MAKKKLLSYIPNAASYLLAVLVILLISFLFPKQINKGFDYEVGNVWKYADLTSPFDYPILKTEEAYQNELEELGLSIRPSFIHQKDLKKQLLASFSGKFDSLVTQNQQIKNTISDHGLYKNICINLLDRIYNKGILENKSTYQGEIAVLYNEEDLKTRNTKDYISLADAKSLIDDRQRGEPKLQYFSTLLYKHIRPNYLFSKELTDKTTSSLKANISRTKGLVPKGEMIIAKGEPITQEAFQKILSYEDKYEADFGHKYHGWLVKLGYLILTILVILILVLYLDKYQNMMSNFKGMLFIFLWIVIYSYLVYLFEKNQMFSVYAIPLTIAPIVIKTFFNRGTAFITHICSVLITSFLCSLGYEYTFISLLTGIVVILSDIKLRYWSVFFRSIFFVLITYFISYIGLELIEKGTFSNLKWNELIAIGVNVFLTLLAYPLIPMCEKGFGFVSELTLRELSDLENPLLKDLSLKAPGTLQHSLQVANLAEAATSKIGGEALLVKVAALYHDIGKLKQPEFYIENQQGQNPHDNLSPDKSAKIIIDHVTEGVKLAKKQGLPKSITRFIKTHHGTTRVEYFYRKYMEQNPNKEVNISDFTYDGPKPKTKEETILMLADSIEATSKSLKEYTADAISNVVEKIINHKVELGQLSESELTFGEIDKCKEVFKKTLNSIHHVRVAYPDDKK